MNSPAVDSFSPSPILRRDNVTPPEWLLEAFAKHNYVQLPSDFCDVHFTKSEYNIELFRCLSEKGVESWRAFATIDGDKYTSLPGSFLFDATKVDYYFQRIEMRLGAELDSL